VHLLQLNCFHHAWGFSGCQANREQTKRFSSKQHDALDTLSALWLNTTHAGVDLHPSALHDRYRADALLLVLLTLFNTSNN
jgi:hypothetical protein